MSKPNFPLEKKEIFYFNVLVYYCMVCEYISSFYFQKKKKKLLIEFPGSTPNPVKFIIEAI